MKLQARASWSVMIWHTSPRYARCTNAWAQELNNTRVFKMAESNTTKQNQIIYTHNFTNQHLKLHSK